MNGDDKVYSTIRNTEYGSGGKDHWLMRENIYGGGSGENVTMGSLMRENQGDLIAMMEKNDRGESIPAPSEKNFLAMGGEVETSMAPPSWLGASSSPYAEGGAVGHDQCWHESKSQSGKSGTWRDGDIKGSWTEKMVKD